jgi:hypothetical protein
MPMPDADLTREVIEISVRLIEEDRAGQIDGSEVASKVRRADIADIDLYYAFKEAQRQGVLTMYFPGGMVLPVLVRRP